MPSVKPGHARGGAGVVLMVVLVILMACGAIAMARKVHASRVSGTAQTATVGALALQGATAAIEEALVLVGERANTPGDPLYVHLRQRTVPGGLDTKVSTPLAAKLMKDDASTAGLVLAGGAVRCTLEARRRAGFASWEHEGRVRLVAEVTHPATGTLRRLVRDHTLRVNMVSTPRPFDQATWLAMRGELLIDDEANSRIRDAVEIAGNLRETVAPFLQRQVRDTLERVNGVIGDTKAGKSGYDAAGLADLFAPERFPEPPRVTASVDDPFHYFPDMVVLYADGERYEDLSWLNLAPRADRLADEVKRTRDASVEAHRRFETAHQGFLAAGRGGAPEEQTVGSALRALQTWLGTVRPLADALVEASAARTRQLDNYREYQDRVVELTGARRKHMLEYAVQLDPEALRARATHRFSGPDAHTKALAMLQKYLGPDASDRGLHGVVWVENEVPLNLDALRGRDGKVHIRGKLTLAAKGAVDLRDVVLENPRADLFTVRAGGVLTASGRVEASLIASGEYRPAAGLSHSGNLVLAGDFDPARLAGKLDNAKRRYVTVSASGLIGEYTQATLSPWPLHAFVARSNP